MKRLTDYVQGPLIDLLADNYGAYLEAMDSTDRLHLLSMLARFVADDEITDPDGTDDAVIVFYQFWDEPDELLVLLMTAIASIEQGHREIERSYTLPETATDSPF